MVEHRPAVGRRDGRPVGDVVHRGLELERLHITHSDRLLFGEHQEHVRHLGVDLVEGEDHEAALLVVDAAGEELEELERDLGVAAHEHLEIGAVELKRLDLVHGDGGRRAGRLLENGHFAENLPGLEHVQGLFDVAQDLHDLHPARLNEKEIVAGLVFAEDDTSLLVGLQEPFEHLAEGIHQRAPSICFKSFLVFW